VASANTAEVMYLGQKDTTRNLMFRFNNEGSQHILTEGLYVKAAALEYELIQRSWIPFNT
jgi:hypothetical protein